MALIRTIAGALSVFFLGKTYVIQSDRNVLVSDYNGTVNKQANRPAFTSPNRICQSMSLSAGIEFVILYEDELVSAGGTTYTFDSTKKVIGIFFGDAATANITIS